MVPVWVLVFPRPLSLFLELKNILSRRAVMGSCLDKFSTAHENLSFYFSLDFEGSPPAEDP
jgi:hypothetical protein